jgi:hypothetical protein
VLVAPGAPVALGESGMEAREREPRGVVERFHASIVSRHDPGAYCPLCEWYLSMIAAAAKGPK